MTFAFDFRTRAVAPPLDRLVEVLWSARGTVPYDRERIAPTGSTVAVFVFGDAIAQTPRNGAGETYVATRAWVTGPHETPVLNAPRGETHAVGIVTTAVGCGALFGVSPAELHGRAVSLEEVWAPAAALRDELAAIDDAD